MDSHVLLYDNYSLYFYLAKAQAAEGYMQDAYLSRARMYKAFGNNKAAIRQLNIGLKQKGKNPYGSIQIKAMLIGLVQIFYHTLLQIVHIIIECITLLILLLVVYIVMHLVTLIYIYLIILVLVELN